MGNSPPAGEHGSNMFKYVQMTGGFCVLNPEITKSAQEIYDISTNLCGERLSFSRISRHLYFAGNASGSGHFLFFNCSRSSWHITTSSMGLLELSESWSSFGQIFMPVVGPPQRQIRVEKREVCQIQIYSARCVSDNSIEVHFWCMLEICVKKPRICFCVWVKDCAPAAKNVSGSNDFKIRPYNPIINPIISHYIMPSTSISSDLEPRGRANHHILATPGPSAMAA